MSTVVVKLTLCYIKMRELYLQVVSTLDEGNCGWVKIYIGEAKSKFWIKLIFCNMKPIVDYKV